MSSFKLPDLGEGLHDAEIIEWHVAPGDQVKAGQTLVSVETDKALVDIPSPRDGKIESIHGDPGLHIAVGASLVDFDDSDTADNGALVGRLPDEESAPLKTETVPTFPKAQRIKATPAVRARARSLGIDLETVTASGPDGQVTGADLDLVAATEGTSGTESLRGARRAMALNMAQAHSQVACATVTDDAIVSHWSEKTDVTILLVKAVATAAKAVPVLNSWFDGQALSRTPHEEVHVGVAVDTAEGLFVPVLRNAATREAGALRDDLDRLKAAIASRTISHDDLRGPTITISNFGTLGGRYAALSLLPPQVAILGAGAIADRVIGKDQKPVVCATLPLSLTFDHRAATGGDAARFLAATKEYLEKSE